MINNLLGLHLVAPRSGRQRGASPLRQARLGEECSATRILLKVFASEDASCNCGAPLMSKAQRAAEAIAANPQKSNRALAEEAGVSEGTVRTARRTTPQGYAVADEPRVGIDGKQRRMRP